MNKFESELMQASSLRDTIRESDEISAIKGLWTEAGGQMPRFAELLSRNSGRIEGLFCRLAKEVVEFHAAGGSFSPLRGEIGDYGSSIFSNTEIYSDEDLTFALQYVDASRLNRARALQSRSDLVDVNGTRTVVGCIAGGAVDATLITFEQVDGSTDPSKPLGLEHTREIRIAPGEDWFAIDGNREGMRIDELSGPAVLIYIATPSKGIPCRLAVSATTGEIEKADPLSQVDAKCLSMITYLAEKRGRDPKVIATLERFARHPSYFLRWHALRLLCMLRPDRAIEICESAAARESNPMVSRGLSQLQTYFRSLLEKA